MRSQVARAHTLDVPQRTGTGRLLLGLVHIRLSRYGLDERIIPAGFKAFLELHSPILLLLNVVLSLNLFFFVLRLANAIQRRQRAGLIAVDGPSPVRAPLLLQVVLRAPLQTSLWAVRGRVQRTFQTRTTGWEDLVALWFPFPSAKPARAGHPPWEFELLRGFGNQTVRRTSNRRY